MTIAPESRCSAYDRDDYRYSQSLEQRLIERDGHVSGYTGARFYDVTDSQIEHVVALSEAHDSGACGWSEDRKSAFASDLRNLVLAEPEINRSKGGRDAGEWLPAEPSARCRLAATVVEVKAQWNLSIDRVERRALKKVLVRC